MSPQEAVQNAARKLLRGDRLIALYTALVGSIILFLIIRECMR